METFTIQLLVLVIGQILVVATQYIKNKKLKNEVAYLTKVNDSKIANHKTRVQKPPTVEYFKYKEPRELVEFLESPRTLGIRIIANGGNGSECWIVYELYEPFNWS